MHSVQECILQGLHSSIYEMGVSNRAASAVYPVHSLGGAESEPFQAESVFI